MKCGVRNTDPEMRCQTATIITLWLPICGNVAWPPLRGVRGRTAMLLRVTRATVRVRSSQHNVHLGMSFSARRTWLPKSHQVLGTRPPFTGGNIQGRKTHVVLPFSGGRKWFLTLKPSFPDFVDVTPVRTDGFPKHVTYFTGSRVPSLKWNHPERVCLLRSLAGTRLGPRNSIFLEGNHTRCPTKLPRGCVRSPLR